MTVAKDKREADAAYFSELHRKLQSQVSWFSIVFTGTQTFCEGCECWKNGKIQHSHFVLQKLAKIVRGFGSIAYFLFLVQQNFKKVWNFLRKFPASREQLTTIPNFQRIRCECWMLPFFWHSHPSQNIHMSEKTMLYVTSHSMFTQQKFFVEKRNNELVVKASR